MKGSLHQSSLPRLGECSSSTVTSYGAIWLVPGTPGGFLVPVPGTRTGTSHSSLLKSCRILLMCGEVPGTVP
jgi:hypothetical protein